MSVTMLRICSLAIFSLVFGTLGETKPQEERKTFHKYQVWRTDPIVDENAIESMMEFDGLEDISFWKYPAIKKSVDIMVSPEKSKSVKEKLEKFGIKHRILIEDLEKLITNQNDEDRQNARQAALMNWDNFYRYDVIRNYLMKQAQDNHMVSYESIGQSTEGREIGLVKISSDGKGKKDAIFIEGGMHPREWISPATVIYIMHKLITDDNFKDLVEKFDWFLVPVVNVDGYEYTHTKNRFWRKTRSSNKGSTCIGTDANRNWDFDWGVNSRATSDNFCSDVYYGSKAFSEPETSALANAIKQRQSQIKVYLSFHSYGQSWLLPWSSRSKKTADFNELYRLAETGVKALTSTFGTKYEIGTAPDLVYPASGVSSDWARGSAGIKYSYAVELRDNGKYGFLLPPSEIQPTGEETFRGVAAMARALDRTENAVNG